MPAAPGPAPTEGYTGMAKSIVSAALVGVRQDLIGLFGLFELFLGFLRRIALIAVRVVLHRELAIGLLDLVFACILGNAKNFVVITFCHATIPYRLNEPAGPGAMHAMVARIRPRITTRRK